jgi:hypothetical protein
MEHRARDWHEEYLQLLTRSSQFRTQIENELAPLLASITTRPIAANVGGAEAVGPALIEP